jgi:NADPH-dependent curcumin reductase
MINTQVLLTARPQGMAKADNFIIRQQPVQDIAAGEVLVKIEYVSLDPAMRGWMNEGTTYTPGVVLNTVMRAFAVGYVVKSNSNNFKTGDAVQGLLGVQQYAVCKDDAISKIEVGNFPLSWYLGVLGMPGLTAYFGLLEKGKPAADETILISGAAGMVGSLAGQIAKIKGCKVIGIAGGAAKCDYLTTTLGFDAAIDYKTQDVTTAIKKIAPDGVNVYFDNVGGEILDAALLNLARGARVVICGAISQYNNTGFNGLKNYMKIVTARATLSGVIVFDYFPVAATAIADLSNWLTSGSIQYREHVITGIENFVPALQMLFTGDNNGKLVLQV